MQNSDPFEINKVKVPKANTGFDAAQKAGQYARKVGRKATSRAYNKISQPEQTRVRQSFQPYRRFGRMTDGQKINRSAERHVSYITGLGTGALVGGAASIPISAGGSKRDKQIKSNQATIRSNNKAIKEQRVGKAFKMPGAKAKSYAERAYKAGGTKRPRLITDLGTKRGRYEAKQEGKYPGLRPGAFAGGAAVGGLLTAGTAAATRDAQKQELARQDRRIKNQNKTLSKGAIVAKREDKASLGRQAAGAYFAGAHGAVAGKKGKKLRAAGNELGGAFGGGIGGGLAATALTRGKSPAASQLGTAAGSWAGGMAGVRSAHNKGYYKPMKKNDSTSAFGVDHGY